MTMQWLTGNWRDLLSEPLLSTVLVTVSLICGAVVGANREIHNKPTGLRTLMLVSLGSTVFTMVSFVFSTTTADSGRVAAQIVTGIGFLGAGAIIRGKFGITGLTSAA